MAHDVFISHSSKDKPTADAVCALLESDGLRCWIAPRDVQAGVSYAGAIIDAVNECRAMVLIFSDAANDSPQIEREVERAANRRIPILPFRIENVTPERGLEYFLSTPHWLDAFTPPMETHIRELSRQLHALLDPRPAAIAPASVLPAPAPVAKGPAVKAPAAAAPARSRMTTGTLVAIGAVLVGGALAVAGGAAVWLHGQKPTPAGAESRATAATSAVASSEIESSASTAPPASNASAAPSSAAAPSAAAEAVASLPPASPKTERRAGAGASGGGPAVNARVGAIGAPPMALRGPPRFRPPPMALRRPPRFRPPPHRPPPRRLRPPPPYRRRFF
jgi:hypothetical protein